MPTEHHANAIVTKLQARLSKLPAKELEEIAQKVDAVAPADDIHIDSGGTHIHVK